MKKEIKGTIINDIETLSEQLEEGYYKPVRAGNFWNKTKSNMKVVMIEIKPIGKRIP